MSNPWKTFLEKIPYLKNLKTLKQFLLVSLITYQWVHLYDSDKFANVRYCIDKSSRPVVFCKNSVLKNFTKLARKIPVLEYLTQLFSCEHCKIFKSTYFEDYLRTAGSKLMRLLICVIFWKSSQNSSETSIRCS